MPTLDSLHDLLEDEIKDIYDAAGLTAAQNNNPIGRCWRDIHTTRQHIRLATTRYEVYGRIKMGIPAGSPLI